MLAVIFMRLQLLCLLLREAMFVQGQALQRSIPGPRSQPVCLWVSETVTVYTRMAPRALPRQPGHAALQSWASLLPGFDVSTVTKYTNSTEIFKTGEKKL